LGGKLLTLSISGKPIFDPDGTFLGYRGVARDVTAEEVARRHIEHLANHDHLTGLANRAAFEHGLRSAIEAADAGMRRSSVLLLDLDNFKDINDTRGHSAGDAMLVEVAQRLKALVGPQALVARLGGDEFAVLLMESSEDEASRSVACGVIEALARPFSIGADTIQGGCSVGIVRIPDDGLTPTQIMGNADLALYEAKTAGRRRYRFFDAAMRLSVDARREVLDEFGRAIEAGELELYYQPQVRTVDRTIVGFEALMRWNHPQRGLLLPGAFRPALEDSRLAVRAGRWVAETAARQLRAWRDAGLPPVRMAINLSQAQFREDDLPGLVRGVMISHDIDPALIELEVTENILLDEVIDIAEPLKALAALGVSIALDDFGTGYASLSHLRRFPINRIKIDRQFVRDIGRRADGATIAQAIVALGTSLGLGVTAEGIETQEQELFLRLSGCDEVQGYFYARPMPADQATAYLRRPAEEFAIAG
jgi:diguanylate cyclase (GGDEF)-like protein